MKSMHEYKKLRVWKEAMDLVKDIYVISDLFPESEKFGIVKQIKRSAVSIPSNIAEGEGRNTTGEFKNFLGFAYGSVCELETQLLISGNLNFLNDEIQSLLISKLTGVQKMLFNLMKSLNK